MRLCRQRIWSFCLALLLFAVSLAVFWARSPQLDELRSLVRRSEWKKAKTGLLRYVRGHPDAEEAWFLLSQVQQELGESAPAAESLERIPEGSPRRAGALYRQGELHLDQGHVSRAETCWLKVASLEQIASDTPGKSLWIVWALGRLGDLYVLENRTEDARNVLWRLFHSFRKEDVARADLLFRLTVFDVQAYDPQHAIDQLESFDHAGPDDIEVKRALVVYYLKLGKMDRSRTLMDQLATSHPTDPRVWKTHLEYLVTTGDRPGLREALSQTSPAKASDSIAWKYRGIDHENYGELDQAIDCYRQCVRLAPRDYQSGARLAQSLRLAGRQEEYRVQMELVSTNGRLLSELSSYASKLPTEIGTNLTRRQCLEFAEMCGALGWDAEAAAWQELAEMRSPSRSSNSATSEARFTTAGFRRGLETRAERVLCNFRSPVVCGWRVR